MYSIAALNGTVSSIGFEQVVATFLFAGTIGAIGAKGSYSKFKSIGQIESSYLKYTVRDIIKGKPIISTIVNRGLKYFKSFIFPTFKSAAISGVVNAIASIFDFYMQKLYNIFH